MYSINRILACALIIGLLVACATSPTGRTQLMLVSEQTAINASREAYLTTVKDLNKSGKIDQNLALRKRVTTITGRLVTEAIKVRPETANWDWSVVIIDEPETVNAWCMAGGRMAIYTGLLEQVKPTDDELAQVMGHEISHALANHTAEKMSIQMATSLGVVAVGAVSGNKNIALTGAALTAMLAINLPNSRAAEKEADRMGIELAARAGYNPAAAVTLWQKMKSVSRSGTPQFLSTHPAPERRQQRLAALVPEMQQVYLPNAEHPVYPL